MKRHPILLTILVILAGISACIDPFNPPEVNNSDRYLVYDGYLQANGTDTSWITLSRTQRLQETFKPIPEIAASVSVHSASGQAYTFLPDPGQPGVYYLPPTDFNRAEPYRLLIKLQDGKTYESNEQHLHISPDIDSISYEIKGNDGVQVYAHTHDPAGKTLFYKWTYDETWEYAAPMVSMLEVINKEIVPREISVFKCWDDFRATNINVFTTATLSKDVVRFQPIVYIPISTNKLFWKYSINVKQQALSREGFDYWTEIARNTETNGSIFDPFPSQVSGNITCVTDPKEKVFGYFTGGVTKSERIFITEALGRSPVCFGVDTMSGKDVLNSTMLISSQLPFPDGRYIVAPGNCLDCRTQGGTLNRPSFWR